MMRSLRRLLFSCALLSSGALPAQQLVTLDLSDACLLDEGNTLPSKEIYLYGASTRARKVVGDILRAVAIQENKFEVMSGSVPNALATMRDIDEDGVSERLVLYSEAYLAKYIDDPENKWIVYFVFAHELGHHVNLHALGNAGHRPTNELAADRWAGWVLHRLKATLPQATAWVRQASVDGGPFYPGRVDRTEAVTKGWMDYADENPVDPINPSVNRSSRCAMSLTYNGLGVAQDGVTPAFGYGVIVTKFKINGRTIAIPPSAFPLKLSGIDCGVKEYEIQGFVTTGTWNWNAVGSGEVEVEEGGTLNLSWKAPYLGDVMELSLER